MNGKFFTISLLLVFIVNLSFAQRLLLQNESNGKIEPLPYNQKITFQLYSDSTLGTAISDDEAMIITYNDSALILDDQRTILFSDFKFIKVFPKARYKAKVIASPFLVSGVAITLRGLIMTFGEGLESKNRVTAPLYLLVGGIITTAASIPYWGLPKKYILGKNSWQITPLSN
jgi:hypothetical protein